MKITFIFGSSARKSLRDSIVKEFFTRPNGRKYAQIIRDNIFEEDNNGIFNPPATRKRQIKILSDMMHEYIGEKGHFVVGMESFIKSRARHCVTQEIFFYFRRNYPQDIK